MYNLCITLKLKDCEFLNLTKLRGNKSQMHLKELTVKSTGSDKNFYREKFKELKMNIIENKTSAYKKPELILKRYAIY